MCQIGGRDPEVKAPCGPIERLASGSEVADDDADTDELAVYLASPCENVTDDDVLAWWRGQTQYPRLSRMAVSYLSCPGASSGSFFVLCC